MFYKGKYFKTVFEIRGVSELYLSAYTRTSFEESCYLRQLNDIKRFQRITPSLSYIGFRLYPLPYVDLYEKSTGDFIRRFRSLDDLCHMFGEKNHRQ